MSKRLNPYVTAPETMKPMIALEASIKESGLEHSLIHLMKMRASQINGCAYCLHMHIADARKAGETEIRIALLSAWEESELFTPRERAVLRWTEELTRLVDRSPSDEAFAELREHFDEKDCVDLSVAIGMINLWNRINCGFRTLHPNDRRREKAAA